MDAVHCSDLDAGDSTPPRRKAIPSNSDKAAKEESEKTDPKKQTLEALYQLLEKTTSENRLRENIPGILQLLSDLPPYSLFNEENTTLDTFEETLISFLEKTDNAKQKIKNRQQVCRHSFSGVKLILCLFSFSIPKTFVLHLYILYPNLLADFLDNVLI